MQVEIHWITDVQKTDFAISSDLPDFLFPLFCVYVEFFHQLRFLFLEEANRFCWGLTGFFDNP